jgi:hypothetical protein
MNSTSESVVQMKRCRITLDSILGMCGCAFGAPHVLIRSMTQVKPASYRCSVLDTETERHRTALFGNIA